MSKIKDMKYLADSKIKIIKNLYLKLKRLNHYDK